MKKLKIGLIAGALACAFALSTPLFVGCGDDDQKIKDLEKSKTELQQQNSTIQSNLKFALAFTETNKLPVTFDSEINEYNPTEAEVPVLQAQRASKVLLKMFDAKTINIGEIYEVAVKDIVSENTYVYRYKFETTDGEYRIYKVQVGELNSAGTAQDIGNTNEILNMYAVTYTNNKITKVADFEYQKDASAPINTTTIAANGSYTLQTTNMTAEQKTQYNTLLTQMKATLDADHKISIED